MWILGTGGRGFIGSALALHLVQDLSHEVAPPDALTYAANPVSLSPPEGRRPQWGQLIVEKMNRGYAWLDTRAHDSLLEASELVRTIQHRQRLQVACLEEIAYLQGFIAWEQLVTGASSSPRPPTNGTCCASPTNRTPRMRHR